MAQEPSPSAGTPFAIYNGLVAQYRDAVKRCQAQLDELDAAERQLQAYSGAMNGKATPTAFGTIEALRSELAKHCMGPQTGPQSLSDREREVFELIGAGLTTAQIAKQLSVALSTVETYRERLKVKLDLPTGNALIREAVLWAAAIDQPPRCFGQACNEARS